MLDWETASTATKVTLVGALSLMGVGIVIAMIGVASDTRFVIFTGIGLMALGIVMHLVGYAVRFAEARRAMRSSTREATPNRKGNKR
jgi:Zn-dependent membrane protease YugP